MPTNEEIIIDAWDDFKRKGYTFEFSERYLNLAPRISSASAPVNENKKPDLIMVEREHQIRRFPDGQPALHRLVYKGTYRGTAVVLETSPVSYEPTMAMASGTS